MAHRELVVDRGEVRQAGTAKPGGATISAFKARAERDLFVFARGVLGYSFLTEALHWPVCRWLQRVPPQRKMLLMPRDHGKSTLVERTLPLHMLIQPANGNLYFPGVSGACTRILMCGETETMAKGNLRVVRTALESNDLLRTLWPHITWTKPKRDSKVWNDRELIVPRPQEFAEPTLDAVGVGGARTGKHPNVLIKGDITTEAAANSPQLMQTAIEWHVNTRAMLPPNGLEFITATYWTPDDLPHMVEHDPTVEVNTRFRAIVTEDSERIWPEYITAAKVDDLMREYGPRFWLLYMNTVRDTNLVDFQRADLRFFDLEGDAILFEEDDRDAGIRTADWADPIAETARIDARLRGRSLSDPEIQADLRKRAFRARVT